MPLIRHGRFAIPEMTIWCTGWDCSKKVMKCTIKRGFDFRFKLTISFVLRVIGYFSFFWFVNIFYACWVRRACIVAERFPGPNWLGPVENWSIRLDTLHKVSSREWFEWFFSAGSHARSCWFNCSRILWSSRSGNSWQWQSQGISSLIVEFLRWLRTLRYITRCYSYELSFSLAFIVRLLLLWRVATRA